MTLGESHKCDNCGANLEPQADSTLKCNYCGSIFPADSLPPSPLPAEPQETVGETAATPPAKPDPVKNGCAFAFLICCVLLAFFAVIYDQTGWSPHLYSSSDDIAILDSTALPEDTPAHEPEVSIVEDLKTARVEVSPENREYLKALISIKVDEPEFKKLYADARKQARDEGEVHIFDKSSPKREKSNAIYVYIYKNSVLGSTLFLVEQYAADKWILIEDATLIGDGEKYNHAEKFYRERKGRMAWEHSDATPSADGVKALAKIALAKKALVVYKGELASKTIIITIKEQTALKRQLQIYKGLLLGYNKR